MGTLQHALPVFAVVDQTEVTWKVTRRPWKVHAGRLKLKQNNTGALIQLHFYQSDHFGPRCTFVRPFTHSTLLLINSFSSGCEAHPRSAWVSML